MHAIDVGNYVRRQRRPENSLCGCVPRCQPEGVFNTANEGTSKMTALRKTHHVEAIAPVAGLFEGDGVEMFSSGSAPQGSADLMSGDAVSLFSSGSAPVGLGDAVTGDAVEMFSSGSAPATRAELSGGEGVEMFSSGSAPVAGGAVATGEATHMFSSGS